MINEQWNKDCIWGEKRILVEMRLEVPFVSVKEYFLNSPKLTVAERACAVPMCMLCEIMSQSG
jgi:hypothetical protein